MSDVMEVYRLEPDIIEGTVIVPALNEAGYLGEET